jgi:hypothetical protein
MIVGKLLVSQMLILPFSDSALAKTGKLVMIDGKSIYSPLFSGVL